MQRDVGVRRCRRRGSGDAGAAASAGRQGRRCTTAAPGPLSTRHAAIARAVGAPPVAAETVHLLGGDEVGAAPRDLGVGSRRRAPSCVPSSSAMRSRLPLTYATRRASGSGCGSNTGPSTASSRAAALSRPADEQPAGERERGHGHRSSVANAVMPPAPSRMRSRRARSSGGRSSSAVGRRRGASSAPDRPPAARCRRAATAPTGSSPGSSPARLRRNTARLAVGRHGDVARLAEREPLGAGVLPTGKRRRSSRVRV